jgi:RecG-like helicase
MIFWSLPRAVRKGSLPDLALAIVDEQHRFGVHRSRAGRKGEAVDMLVLTRRRSRTSLYFGDMDLGAGKAAGRQPIDTRTIALDRQRSG